ncbi:hypothetical protein LTR94_028281 [Friedmanniomyces endolithicus]|nr:hypothetical protein LTR94_028281 [Friedmanniomyces endolithicus]
MARYDGNDTSISQFFLMRQPYPALDKRYTVWGRVVSGLEVVRTLNASPNPDGLVADPDRMTRVRLSSNLSAAERPQVQIVAPGSDRFRTLVEETRQARGADFSVTSPSA